MNIAPTLVKQLAKRGITFDTVSHDYTHSSLHTAHVAHVPAEQMVKPVILEDEQGYIMALIPANQQVKIRELNMSLNRNMGLATEQELKDLFTDCDLGAIPPVGDAYGIETIVDNNFNYCSDVYIEAGNHTDLLHLSGYSFNKLMKDVRHADICIH
jgi:Ala-tRNA(Pro) deacylase